MICLRRTMLWLTLPLLLLLAAAAFALSGPTQASAASDYPMTDLYTLRLYNASDGDVSVSLNFMVDSDQPGFSLYYADVSEFSHRFPAGKTLESFSNNTMIFNPFNRPKPQLYFEISYNASTDRFIFKFYYNHEICQYYCAVTTQTEPSRVPLFLKNDCEELEAKLFHYFKFSLRFNASNISSLVTFLYQSSGDLWSDYTQLYYFGDTPTFPESFKHWNRVFFRGWSPEIAPVTTSEPVTYTAQYEYPSILVKQADGTTTRQYLKYDYIDESLLFNDFTDSVDDVASTNVTLGELVNFRNRKDFWYWQTADTETKHTIDTNLTLEAISFRLKNKETGTLYRLESAREYEKEVSGGFWGELVYAWKAVKHTFENWGESFLAAMQTLFTGEKDLQDEQTMDFLYEYYPAFAQEAPDHYELVYMYYYSVDLKEQIENGTVEDGYFDYEDTYKDSVLTVTNNINGIGYSVTNSYSLEKGNYFVLDMARYWQSMGYITKEQFVEDYSAVRILNAKYRITTDHGEVVYDTSLAADLQQALTTVVYYYTGDYHPNYADSYSLTVTFYDVTVYKEADKVLPEQIKDWLQPVLDFFSKVGAWFKKYGWWILAAVLAVPVIWLLVIVIKWIVKTVKRIVNALRSNKQQPPQIRQRKRRAKR